MPQGLRCRPCWRALGQTACFFATMTATHLSDSPSVQALQQALVELRSTVDGLMHSLAEFHQMAGRARKAHGLALALALLVALAAWVWGGSAWLRWAVLPLTGALVLLFEGGFRWMARRMQSELRKLELQTQVMEARMQQAPGGAPPATAAGCAFSAGAPGVVPMTGSACPHHH